MSSKELRERYEAVCGLITSSKTSDEEVAAAIAEFRTIDADDETEKKECLFAIEDTLEWRSPMHQPGLMPDRPKPRGRRAR